MLPEIWSVTDIFFVTLGHYLPFYPNNNLENQNFEKMKKTPEDITLLQMCTINQNNMMYNSWDIRHDGQNHFSFLAIFNPFIPPPLTVQKIKMLKK